jgi:hypothetical protein
VDAAVTLAKQIKTTAAAQKTLLRRKLKRQAKELLKI